MSESADDMITYIKISHRLYKKKKKKKTPQNLPNKYVNLAMLQDITSTYKVNCNPIYQQ